MGIVDLFIIRLQVMDTAVRKLLPQYCFKDNQLPDVFMPPSFTPKVILMVTRNRLVFIINNCKFAQNSKRVNFSNNLVNRQNTDQFQAVTFARIFQKPLR